MSSIDELKARAEKLKVRHYTIGEGGHSEVFFDLGQNCHVGRVTFTIMLQKIDEAAERVKASARVCDQCDGTGKSSEYSRTIEGYINCNNCDGTGVRFEEEK